MKSEPNIISQFDVFLSHSSVDKPWVIRLKDDLLRYGVSVWLDKDEIRPGDFFGKALEQALDNCLAVALIVSPEAIKSGWVQEEYYSALSLAKTKQTSVQIIPVILKEAELPSFLQSRNWVDFRDETAYAQNVWTLVWGITGEKPAQVLNLSAPDLPSVAPVPSGRIHITNQLMLLFQLYELPEEATSILRDIPHDQLVDAFNKFLFHHGPSIGIRGWGDNIHGLRDGGVDAVWNCDGQDTSIKLGIQIKSHGDFESGKDESFRRSVLAQIAESRQVSLSRLILGLCADLTSASQREKCRGLLADVNRMTDDYVIAIAPEKMAGLWKWSLGLQTGPLAQIQEGEYAWLTSIYDSLGNLNQNSWGKRTGGDWSNPKTTTIRVGQQIQFSAIASSSTPGDIQYRFSVQRSGRSFKVCQNWSSNPNWTWSVVQGDIGRNVLVMISVRRVKDYYQFDDADDYTYAAYDVLPMKQN